jgi:hypothetical protein
MDKGEAAKLLSLIKLSYPTAYRDIDRETANATVNMWQMSFPDVPYPIMEQAFNHYRMASKFPPTVAEMVEELRHLHYQAMDQANLYRIMDNHEAMKQCISVMSLTARYKDTDNLGGLDITRLPALNGGGENVQRLGASRNYPCAEDRLPFLGEGAGGP